MKKIFFFFLLLVSALSVFSQNRVRNFDVEHYVIRTNFDRAGKVLYGNTTVRLKPLASNFNSFTLDAAGMNFESVLLEPAGKPLAYSRTGEKIAIALDKSYAPGDIIAIRFKYSTKPQKGVYFVGELREGGNVVRASQIWTQGEPEEAHHWFPSYDFPDDKATTEQFITVLSGETAIANGELLETIENPDGTKTFHYRMPIPHSTYLTSFVVGKYAKVSEQYKTVALNYYVYPGKESVVPNAYGRTKDMMRVFEELTGVDFPFNKYDQTIVANFQFGGMENITATTMADTEILLSNLAFGKEAVTDLVSHELAHSWFGNLVTTKNWSHLWLNEGFATFMEAAYREKLNGRADYLRKIREDALRFMASDATGGNRHGLLNVSAKPDESLFDTTTYLKGGAVIHTLRETVGNESFWKAVNVYLNRHKFGNVETEDLKRVMEDASGQDLTWFFEQWIHQAGYPKLSVKQVYNPRTKRLSLTVTQMQKIDFITPAAFTLPMEVEIETAEGAKIEKIKIDKRHQIFTFKTGAKPLKITFDKEEKIPIKSVKIFPLSSALVKTAR